MTPTVKPTGGISSHPDELIAKDFRLIQSSRRGYYPDGKNEWIAAMEEPLLQGRQLLARCQDKFPLLY
jgi:hypothetical protein